MDRTDIDGKNSAIPRLPDGRFAQGGPGRPKGARNKLNKQLLDAVADLTSQSVMVLREQLNQNNIKAAIYVLDRFLPSERAIEIQSSEPTAWADALANGDVTPSEAARAAQALKTITDATAVTELQARLDELERRFGLGGSA